jgi:hypothetical protein
MWREEILILKTRQASWLICRHHVPFRRRIPERRDEYDVLEVAPRKREERRAEGGDWRREMVYVTGRGSLYEKDEEERRRRRKSKVSRW